MYWEEKTTDEPSVPDDVIDVVFGISCKTLPVDHAYSLSNAIRKEFDWIEEPGVGVHTIHVAASGNGWMRPEDGDQLLYPSRRTKLTLRVPSQRIEDAKTLVGKTLDIAGNVLTVNNVNEKKLSNITTLFSRYIAVESAIDETEFMESILEELKENGIRPKKMLCGKEIHIAKVGKKLVTRSLMIADLSVEHSLQLQQKGLGSHRWMGCGIFLPHKDIDEIGETMG